MKTPIKGMVDDNTVKFLQNVVSIVQNCLPSVTWRDDLKSWSQVKYHTLREQVQFSSLSVWLTNDSVMITYLVQFDEQKGINTIEVNPKSNSKLLNTVT